MKTTELSTNPSAGWRYTAYGATSCGQCRKTNEDSYLCLSDNGIWLVADGVGGNAGGKVASQLVCDELPALILAGTSPRGAIALIHARIKQASEHNEGLSGMATTLVLARQSGEQIDICWTGDSRAYVYNRHNIQLITRDHSLIQQLRDRGLTELCEKFAASTKHVLTKCVGSVHIDVLNADSVSVRLAAAEKLLLCSDGLTNELDDMEIYRIISGAANSAEAIEELLSAANLRGGSDNITAVLIDAPMQFEVSSN